MNNDHVDRTLYFELSEDMQQRSGLGRFVYAKASTELRLFWSAVRIWEVADGQARFLKNRHVSVALLPDPEELTLVLLSAQQVNGTNSW